MTRRESLIVQGFGERASANGAEDARLDYWRSFWERTIAFGAKLYEDSGGDADRCEICDELLDGAEPWKRGLDGAGAHISCLRAFGVSA